MMNKHKLGRPIASRSVRVTPEFRDNPDIDKLVRAMIAISKSLAEKKTTECRKGEAVK
jgi:hypothetical protein